MPAQPDSAGLTLAQCVAQADEWAMLSRRSEKWLWLVASFVKWQFQEGAALRFQGSTTRLQSFLDQRHALTQGWNRAYRNDWVTKFNDFYLFALTARIVG